MYIFAFFTALGIHWILNGQHQYQAAAEHRVAAQKRGGPLPTWTTQFRCLVIKEETPLEIVRRIAGRQQARSQAMRVISFTQTCEFFLQAVEVCSLQPCWHVLISPLTKPKLHQQLVFVSFFCKPFLHTYVQEKRVDQPEGSGIFSIPDILRETYSCTAKTVLMDGSMVCTALFIV